VSRPERLCCVCSGSEGNVWQRSGSVSLDAHCNTPPIQGSRSGGGNSLSGEKPGAVEPPAMPNRSSHPEPPPSSFTASLKPTLFSQSESSSCEEHDDARFMTQASTNQQGERKPPQKRCCYTHTASKAHSLKGQFSLVGHLSSPAAERSERRVGHNFNVRSLGPRSVSARGRLCFLVVTSRAQIVYLSEGRPCVLWREQMPCDGKVEHGGLGG
jgi:hypothetical protein